MRSISERRKGPDRYTYGGYRIRAMGIFFFFVAYVTMAVHGDLYSRYGEHYPIFSWSLFSEVGGERAHIELFVHRVGEKIYDPPIEYTSLGDDFHFAKARDSAADKAVMRLAKAMFVESENVEAQRKVIESQVLDGRSGVDYEIRYVRFRPLERWREGKIRQQETIGRFTSGEFE